MTTSARKGLPLLLSAVLITSTVHIANAQPIDPTNAETTPAPAAPVEELPETAIADKALEDPVADQNPEESAAVRESAEEMGYYSNDLPKADNSVGDSYVPFYHDPVDLTAARSGQLLRSEPVRNPANTLGITNIGPYKAQRILYASVNRQGKKIPVSGIVIEPKAEWTGKGPRPVIAYAPGTQGVADRCAPSRKIADGVGDYEQFFFEELLKAGYAVAMTDYEGLGTPGMHTYMDRLSQGHAVLDSARAAQQLTGWDITAENPVIINGYSQGGGAAASAAELYDDYAPELNVKLATVGAVPADLTLLPPALDGTLYFLFESYALLGLSGSYGEDLYSHLNDEGKAILRNATNTCTLGLMGYAGKKIADVSVDGMTVDEFVKMSPYDVILADQHIGYDAPSIPVVITHGHGDDVVPFSTGEQLAAEWSSRGADVTFLPNDADSHVAGTIPHIKVALDAIAAALN